VGDRKVVPGGWRSSESQTTVGLIGQECITIVTLSALGKPKSGFKLM
jgi:hypothetical protein